MPWSNPNPLASNLTNLLNRWGEWHKHNLLRSTYPGANVLSRIARIGIREEPIPGHKILTKHMSASLQRVQRAWLSLESDEQRQAIWVRYVFDRDEGDRPMTDDYCAGLLEISVTEFGGRLVEARRGLRRYLKSSLIGISNACG